MGWENIPVVKKRGGIAINKPQVVKGNSLAAPVSDKDRAMKLTKESALAHRNKGHGEAIVKTDVLSPAILAATARFRAEDEARKHAPVFTKPNARRKPMPSIPMQILNKAPQVPVFGSTNQHPRSNRPVTITVNQLADTGARKYT